MKSLNFCCKILNYKSKKENLPIIKRFPPPHFFKYFIRAYSCKKWWDKTCKKMARHRRNFINRGDFFLSFFLSITTEKKSSKSSALIKFLRCLAIFCKFSHDLYLPPSATWYGFWGLTANLPVFQKMSVKPMPVSSSTLKTESICTLKWTIDYF